MFASIVGFLSLMACVHASITHPSNTPDGQQLCFSNTVNGVAWPIVDELDLGVMTHHAIHCLELLRDGRKHNTFHSLHCRMVLTRTLEFLEAHPDYSVNEIICQDLRTLLAPGGRTKLNWMYAFLDVKLKGVHDSSPGQLKFDRIWQMAKASNADQQELQAMLMGYNLGALMRRDYQNQTLTPGETAHLDESESDVVPRMAALGLYCMHNFNGLGDAGVVVANVRSLLSEAQNKQHPAAGN